MRLVHGVGISDVSTCLPKKRGQRVADPKPAYLAWSGMLQRCYGKRRLARFPTYEGCSVCKSWITFSNFEKWYNKNYVSGFALDKDLLKPHNKVYGPKTCAYVPQHINKLFNSVSRVVRKNRPHLGVVPHSGKFMAVALDTSKGYKGQISLGSFSDIAEARGAYKSWRMLHIVGIADAALACGSITKALHRAIVLRARRFDF